MSRIRWYPNERVQLNDFELATGKLAMQEMARSVRSLVLPRGRSTTSAASSEARVLEGFASSVVGGLGVGSSLLITAGSAVLGYVEDGAYHFGVVHGDLLPTDATLDFSTSSLDTYNVFVRFVQSDAEQANRVFWNAAGLPPTEEVDTVQTQKVGTWEVTSQVSTLAPPGNGEWFRICQVVVSAGPVISALNDHRHFFFEGSAASSDGPYEQEWGDGANDRDPDRAAYGVGDLHMWAQLVRRQLRDIIGAAHFTLAPTSLVEMVIGHWGTTAGADAGKHKDITVGATGKWWDIVTFAGASDDWLRLVPVGNPNSAQIAVVFEDTGGDTNIYLQPRGGNPLDDGDLIRIWFGYDGAAPKLSCYRNAADDYLIGFSTSDPSAAYMRVGSAAAQRGFFAPYNANFWTEPKTLSILVPFNSMVYSLGSASQWGIIGSPSGNPVGSDVLLQQNVGLASDELYLEFNDFPEDSTLNHIAICWKQDAVAGTRSRMYAARYTMASQAIGDVPGDTPIVRASLKSTAPADYIEYDGATGVNRITRFTCNQNNGNLHRKKDKIVIGLITGDNTADRLAVAWIQMNFTYESANPWPHVDV